MKELEAFVYDAMIIPCTILAIAIGLICCYHFMWKNTSE